MIITKSFEIGISGKFQTRKFGTTLTFDTTNPIDMQLLRGASTISLNHLAEEIQRVVTSMVVKDIETMGVTDPNFVIIQAAAQEELDKFVVYQANAKKAESKRGQVS